MTAFQGQQFSKRLIEFHGNRLSPAVRRLRSLAVLKIDFYHSSYEIALYIKKPPQPWGSITMDTIFYFIVIYRHKN